MNFEAWRNSKQYVDNLHAYFIEQQNDCEQPDFPGYVYTNGSWICDLSSNGKAEFFTLVSNEESWSANLTTVEEFLWFNWAEGECNNEYE